MFSRLKTPRRGTIAAMVLALGALAVFAIQKGGLSADASAVVVATATLVVALFAWDTSGRAADITEKAHETAEKAYQTAVEAHRVAEAVAQIERDRWHADLTPQFNFTVTRHSGTDRATLRITLIGPPTLEHLDRVLIQVRDDDLDHTPHAGPPPTLAQVAAHIWGPMTFDIGIDGVIAPGRQTQPFGLECGQSRPFSLRKSPPPPWNPSPMAAVTWDTEYRSSPVRLTVRCELNGFRPWVLRYEVPIT